MAVKQSFTARCDGDGCRNYEDVDSADRLPVGWYRVAHVDELGRLSKTGSFDLCSLRCVERWSKARAVALGEATAKVRKPRERDAQCPHCPEVLTRQGLRLHVLQAHPEAALEAATAP